LSLPFPLIYQDAFVTPGSKPFSAISLKHILQIPNFRYTALGRPQRLHLVYALVENFGVLFAFAMIDFLAISSPQLLSEWKIKLL
jgi:hypothetical protein